MHLVYIHIGKFEHLFNNIVPTLYSDKYVNNNIPEYMFDSIIHSRKYYNEEIDIISDKENILLHQDFFKKNKCNTYSLEDLIYTDEIVSLLTIIYSKFNNFNNKFLIVTFLRLFLLESLIKKYNFVDIFHIENDNLIYYPLNMLDTSLYNIAYTNVGTNFDSAGIFYCKNSYEIDIFINNILHFLNNGYNKCIEYIGGSHISEMEILWYIRKNHNITLLNSLPIIEKNHFIYDGASWGQYLGGSNNGHPKGITFNNHIVGQFININKNNISFEYNNDRHLILNFNRHKYTVINLHLHNKNIIKEFIKHV